jgi:hypothetical protein
MYFTELRSPHGSKPGQAAPKAQGTEKQDELITIGYSVKPKENAIIQDYVHRVYNHFVIDHTAKQHKRMLDNPSIALVPKLVTFSYDSI